MVRAFALVTLALAPMAFAFSNTVNLIRHGEKTSDDSVGLSAQGQQRAQCLRQVFAANSGFNIGYILAQQYKADGSRIRPYQTVKPLADDLGLTVDTHCDRDDPDCVKDAVKAFASSSSKNILICWEHDALSDIAADLGDRFDYPSKHFDLIYQIQNKELTANSPFSEHCQGLDN